MILVLPHIHGGTVLYTDTRAHTLIGASLAQMPFKKRPLPPLLDWLFRRPTESILLHASSIFASPSHLRRRRSSPTKQHQHHPSASFFATPSPPGSRRGKRKKMQKGLYTSSHHRQKLRACVCDEKVKRGRENFRHFQFFFQFDRTFASHGLRAKSVLPVGYRWWQIIGEVWDWIPKPVEPWVWVYR